MNIRDDVPVGERVTHKNRTYEVVEHVGCKFCAFNYKHDEWCITKNPKCSHSERSDATDIIFLRVI